MISCLTIGDPHFKVKNARMSDLMVKKVIDIAQSRKPDFIVVLGDVLDRHESIHVDPLTRATNFLHHLEQIAPLYVIIGNHDRPNNSDFLSPYHPFSAIHQWKNTIVVDKTIIKKIKNVEFIFVPYVPNGKFKEALLTLSDFQEEQLAQIKCIFAHQEFKGAKMGAIISKHGDVWSEDYPLVITGHIHDYQQPQKNILYTGTPMQHGFGDQTDKTISYFIFDDSWKEERIDLGMPKKKTIYLSAVDVINYTPPKNVELRIVIRGTASELKGIMKMNHVKDWKDNGIKVVYKAVNDIQEKNEVGPAMNYLDRLKKKVENDIEQKKWMEKLFFKQD